MTASAMPRAGRLDCVCEPGAVDRDGEDRGGVAPLAAGFAFSILSQVLTLSVLPLAGLALAPSGTLATLPYAAFYVGAALAGLPASLLLDSFGRRAAFSLGASLGAAGGLVLVWALATMHFGGLVLGAFWLGIAGGFSLFYRHAAVPMGGKGPSAMLVVFGAATLASVVAPTVANLAETLATPRAFVGMAAAAALAHMASLAATAALPYQRRRQAAAVTGATKGWRSVILPTLIAALAWFGMTALMGATPIAVVGCAPSEAVAGTIAWHVMAMYAPSLALAAFPRAARPIPLTAGGCALLAAATLVFTFSNGLAALSTAAVLLGVGWSLAMLGTTLWLHLSGPLPRWILGLHDSTLLLGAVLGAIAAGSFIS